MSKKKATPAAVFAACQALDATGKPWNRDDVRLAIGGGGYSVIDPLIQAWRKIKPIKAIAPETPNELLHQVATAIDNHLTDFMQHVESRDKERAAAFETTAANLSDTIATHENHIQQMQQRLEVAQNEFTLLQEQHQQVVDQLNQQKNTNVKLQAENDELRGSTFRLETQIKDEKQLHAQTMQQQSTAFEDTMCRITLEHKQQLAQQKQELIKQNELSENRLMIIIDRERSDAKLQTKEQQALLDQTRQSEQNLKETNTRLSIENKSLSENIEALKSDLHKEKNTDINDLKSALADLTSRFESCS